MYVPERGQLDREKEHPAAQVGQRHQPAEPLHLLIGTQPASRKISLKLSQGGRLERLDLDQPE